MITPEAAREATPRLPGRAGPSASEVALLVHERDAARRELRHFAAAVSHELRNPLTAILGHADLYEAGVLDDDGKVGRAMAQIRSESTRLVALLDRLLAEARAPSADRLEDDREPTALAELGLDGDVPAVGVDD